MVKALSPRQARFVEEYLADLNGTQAAIRAGYKKEAANEQASRLLARRNIKAAVEKGKRERSERTNIKSDRVLDETARLAFSNISHYQLSDDGQVQLAPGAPETAMSAVSSIKRKTFLGEGGDVRHEVELKLWDKPAALRLAGMHLGLWDERSGLNGATILVVNPYPEDKK